VLVSVIELVPVVVRRVAALFTVIVEAVALPMFTLPISKMPLFTVQPPVFVAVASMRKMTPGSNGTELRHVWDENEHGFRVSFR